MPRRRRPYVPKTKGCYECSQRRIHCDRTEPSCQKCSSRGIKCSGLGIRYRFVSRTYSNSDQDKKTPKSISTVSNNNATYDDEISDLNLSEAVDWYDFDTVVDDFIPLEGFNEVAECFSKACSDLSSFLQPGQDGASKFPVPDSPTQNIFGNVKFSTIKGLSVLDSFKECTLDYFADKIGPEMVVIDDRHNGWRYMVLPVAHDDDLVMDAVLSASAFHYRANFGNGVYDPNSHYVRVIRKLKQRQNLLSCDVVDMQRVVLALLVLLVTVVVNGSSDFPVIFRLLESALNVVGEDALYKGDLGGFLRRQIRKLQVYAAPFLSDTEGAEALRSEEAQGFECHRFYSVLYPEHNASFSVMASLRIQAQNIYLKRVEIGPTAQPLISSVDTFKDTLSSLPAGFVGEHTLLWATFIAAAESSTSEQQDFFRKALLAHYRRNGFLNIVRALKHLERIWTRKASECWTSLLPEPRVFVV